MPTVFASMLAEAAHLTEPLKALFDEVRRSDAPVPGGAHP